MAASEASALSFIDDVSLPPSPPVGQGTAPGSAAGVALEPGVDQASVIGPQLVAWQKDTPVDLREAVARQLLLAQLVADQEVSDPNDVKAWTNIYLDSLKNLGWNVTQVSSEYTDFKAGASVHEQIKLLLVAILGPVAGTALAIAIAALDALKAMNSDSPWITIFDRKSNGRNRRRHTFLRRRD